nr:DEAD/DEAH box helicase [Actinomycetota bacterium]NIS30789.1 DEAD/DEAH box helicase [Actinomycetota bacterium]NIT95294.1 DEAD/DEAH box helicase [Actinomycetota bacterium]NIU18966.1 DEAD/DEAH box helicase [Actinomycetota bacterium]NIU65992.1 DEAD/DEAH box helicase [Actinomycetota bacterium]
REAISVAAVAHVVVDEADRMADMGFLPQVEWILRNVESEHQTLLFSATLDGAVNSLIRRYQDEPSMHEVAGREVTVEEMTHRFIAVHKMDKPKVAAAIARSADRTIMFTNTKVMADRLARELKENGVRAAPIHGDLRQTSREKSLRDFSNGRLQVLVATDVAARGIHVDDVDVVLQYDPPGDPTRPTSTGPAAPLGRGRRAWWSRSRCGTRSWSSSGCRSASTSSSRPPRCSPTMPASPTSPAGIPSPTDPAVRDAVARWTAAGRHDPPRALAAVVVRVAGARGVDVTLPVQGADPDPAVLAVEVDDALCAAAGPWLLGFVREALMHAGDRRRGGVHHTAPEVAAEIIDLVFSVRPPDPATVVADPAVGGGVFLLAAAARLPGPPEEVVGRLWGVDTDPLAVAVTTAALRLWASGAPLPAGTVRVADFLAPSPGWGE